MPARDPESRPLGWPRDILIFGIGALGLRLAGSLLLDATDAASATDAAGTAPPPSVALAGTWPEGLAALRANGLGLIDAAGNEARIHLPVYERTGDLPRADLVIVAVKQHQISAVAPAVRRAVRPDGLVLTLQNGLGADAILASHVGAERVAVGVTSAGAALVEPGVVRLAGAGETLIGAAQPGSRPGSSRPNATAPKAIGAGAGEPRILGPRRGPEEGRLSGAPVEVGGSDAASLARLEAIATILTSVGLPTRRVDDIRVAQWRKLAVNAAINGVTAVIRRPNGFLLDSTPARQLAYAKGEHQPGGPS